MPLKDASHPWTLSLSFHICLLSTMIWLSLLCHMLPAMMHYLTMSPAAPPSECGLKPETTEQHKPFLFLSYLRYLATALKSWLPQWHLKNHSDHAPSSMPILSHLNTRWKGPNRRKPKRKAPQDPMHQKSCNEKLSKEHKRSFSQERTYPCLKSMGTWVQSSEPKGLLW